MLERRKRRRKRVCLEGQVTTGLTGAIIDVRVRNLSDRGAEIVVPGGRLGSKTLSFCTSRDGDNIRTASVVWRRLGHFGLRFNDLVASGVDATGPKHPWSRYSPRRARE